MTNLLFILTDDQGAWAMGCAGNEEVRTPNLDRLAAEGMRFDNFFCTSPVCSPARASIMTGRMPSQHGVLDFLHWGRTVPGSATDDIKFLEDQPTYVESLAAAGYNTFLSGKWHLGYAQEPQGGFHDWRPLPSGGTNYYHPLLIENGQEKQYHDIYVSDLFTDNALHFLDFQADDPNPFCLHVHYTAPHSPWGREQHPKDLWDDYHGNCPFESVPGPDEPMPDFLNSFRNSEKDRREKLAGYYASIEAMDRNVGRLLDWLEDHGERENTLVVFMSDNGMNMSHHGVFGKGNATWPQNMFDTSVKIPCLISRPGHVPRGEVDAHLLSQYDWAPTILDYLGFDPLESPEPLPGKSFAPLLRGHSLAEENESIVVFDEYGPVRMIRTREWKLVWRYPAGPHELYNLRKDPGEMHNLFDYQGQEDLVENLLAQLEDFFTRYSRPETDGKLRPVTGRGQLSRPDAQNAFRQRMPEPWRLSLPEEFR